MTPADDPIASEALTGLLAALGRERGVLFELTTRGDAGFVPTATSGNFVFVAGEARFGADSLLPRWLRVNRQALSVPDDIGVFDALLVREQAMLRDVAATTVIPLLVDDQLVAWASVADPADQTPIVGAVPKSVDDVARRLMAARDEARKRTRAEAVARTNKLSLTGQMAAGIAHEVRNPLAAVRSIVQLVRKGALPPSEHGRLLDSVVAEIDRVSSVVTTLLTLGRPPASRPEPIELVSLVSDAVNFCRAYAHQRRQTLEMTLSRRLWVRGDAHEIRQVLVNLILNACQASEDGQTVVILGSDETDEDRDAAAIVQVVDQGAGMPAEVLAQIFEPFFTTKINGGGLGLSFCRDVMRRHGGGIVVTSEAGIGTTVTLTFPQ